MQWTLDTESQLLLRWCALCSPFADDCATWELTARGIDWNRFLALANRYGVKRILDFRRSVEREEWSIALGTIESVRDRIRDIVERVVTPKLSDRALMPLPVKGGLSTWTSGSYCWLRQSTG